MKGRREHFMVRVAAVFDCKGAARIAHPGKQSVIAYVVTLFEPLEVHPGDCRRPASL
jgi:hypothetical protein